MSAVFVVSCWFPHGIPLRRRAMVAESFRVEVRIGIGRAREEEKVGVGRLPPINKWERFVRDAQSRVDWSIPFARQNPT